MARITITPRSKDRLGHGICLSEVSLYWGGYVNYYASHGSISLRASEKISTHPRMEEVRELVDTYPTLFVNVDFYSEEGIPKVSMDINPKYNVTFN